MWIIFFPTKYINIELSPPLLFWELVGFIYSHHQPSWCSFSTLGLKQRWKIHEQITVERAVSHEAEPELCLEDDFPVCFHGDPAAHAPHHAMNKGPGFSVISEKSGSQAPKSSLFGPHSFLCVLSNAKRSC